MELFLQQIANGGLLHVPDGLLAHGGDALHLPCRIGRGIHLLERARHGFQGIGVLGLPRIELGRIDHAILERRASQRQHRRLLDTFLHLRAARASRLQHVADRCRTFRARAPDGLGDILGRQIVRGLLGSLLGGRGR